MTGIGPATSRSRTVHSTDELHPEYLSYYIMIIKFEDYLPLDAPDSYLVPMFMPPVFAFLPPSTDLLILP